MISIIITAFKEQKTIGKAIESILQNPIKEKYELIVVAPDNETLDVAKSYSKRFKQIKIFKDPAEGKPNALNLIFKKAKGNILILTDGDVFIGKNSISKLLEKFQDLKIGAVSGKPVPINSRKKMLGFWGHLLFNIAHKRRQTALKLNKRIFCSGYLYAIRKGIVKEIPKQTFSEDGLISHMIYEAGYKIDYSPESEVYVKYPTNFKDWIIQKKRGVGGYNQIKKWIGKDIRSFKQESSGILDVLKYPKNLREFFYTLVLILARIYLWALILIDINLKNKGFKQIWLRAKTTK